MPGKGKRRFAPFPELVDQDPEKGYTVHDIGEVNVSVLGLGATDREHRRMATPQNIAGAMVARHELGHAAWSPLKETRRRRLLLAACVRAVEDARVNMGLRSLKMPVVFPRKHSEDLQQEFALFCEAEGITQLIVRAVSGIGSNMEARYAKVLRQFHESKPNSMVPWVATILAMAHTKMNRARGGDMVFTYEQGVRIARWLADNLARNDPQAEENAERASRQLANAYASAIQIPEAMEDGDRFVQKPMFRGSHNMRGKVAPFDPRLGAFYGHHWEGVYPGEMTVNEPPREVSVIPPKLEKIRKHSCTDEGVEFRYIERFVTDQRVFKRKRKKRLGGGSVLIDVSGSMGLSEEAIAKMIEAAPEATLIAIYSGADTKGELRIIVANGKRHDDFSGMRHGNIVDVPALEWLSCQAPPRAWLSDGYVTGCRDRMTDDISNACATICRDNFIRRCEGVEGVVRVLKREVDEKLIKPNMPDIT